MTCRWPTPLASPACVKRLLSLHERPTEERDRWRRCLRFGMARRQRRADAGRLPNAVRIDGRPAIVASRQRYGDWEGDTIVGRAHASGLLSLVERKSGFILLADFRATSHRAVAASETSLNDRP